MTIRVVPVAMSSADARLKFMEYDEHIKAWENATKSSKPAAPVVETPKVPPTKQRAGEYFGSQAMITGQQALDERKAPAPTSLIVDIALREAYLAVAEGKQVINLTETFRKAGQDREHRPKLAIGRANWRGVKLTRTGLGALTFQRVSNVDNLEYRFPNDTLGFYREGTIEATAIIPTIPPKLRQEPTEDFAVLWEPLWVNQTAPKEKIDPLLLRPLGLSTPLYVVIAAWDLSPIEAAVLSMA